MKLRTAIATATTAAVLATSGVALAGAASSSGSTPTAQTTGASAPAAKAHAHRGHKARVRIRRLIRRGAAGVITKTIGIDRPTLRHDLRSGQTIAQIATAHDVEPQAVIDALVTAANNRLEKAVTNKRITAERAARIEQRLPARITRLVNNWHPRNARTSTAT